MHAYVYKSRRKADTYVYLREREAFGLLPDPLRSTLGPLDFVLELALTPERKLAREDAARVRANLIEHGFHLQFPPHPGIAHGAPGVDRLRDLSTLAAPPAPPSPGSGTLASLRDDPCRQGDVDGHA